MRSVAATGVVVFLTVAHAAGSATSDRYVLWSARAETAPATLLVTLPADLPDDTRLGAAADLLDRTAGGRLAVASLEGVVIENTDGSARDVVPLAGVYDGRFSPDGSTLVLASLSCAYTDYRCRNVSVVDSDGSDLHLVANHAGAARWLGNGLLAFVAKVGPDDRIGTLELVTPAGRTVRVLGRSFASPAPAPSPNGRQIADQCRAQLVCVRTTTTPARVLARFRGAIVEPVLWTPDGQTLAMTLAGNYTSTTAVGTVRTGAHRRISSPPYVGTDDSVVGWSPDSRTILVQRRCHVSTPCRDQVFAEVVATRARRRLTHDDRKWEAVRWTRTALTYVTPPAG